MKKNWVLSQEAFDALLEWLSSDREQAGLKYEAIRRRLITIFTGRGCYEVEDLADETINRVSSKLPGLKDTYVGDPSLFFYAVANRVYQEFLRRKVPLPQASDLYPENNMEEVFNCLDHCLAQLAQENRQLVVEYYQDDKSARIERRKQLADRLGIGPNALRIRACRIRSSLEKCLQECLDKKIN